MNNIKTVNIKTPMGIKLTLIPFIVFIFLKIGSANTVSITNFTLVLFYIWLLSVFLAKPRVVFKILNQIHYYSLFIFLLFLFLGFSYANGVFSTVKAIGAFIQVLAPIFMYEFYSKFLSKKTVRNLIVITLGIYIYYSFKTILYLELNPLAAREMVSIGVDDSLLIGGGFSLAYGFAILIPVLVYLAFNYSKFEEQIFINNLFTRVLIFFAIIVFLVTIYQSMFAISFLIMLFGSLYSLIRMNKVKKKNNTLLYGVFIIAVFIILSANQLMPLLQNYLASLNTVISNKLLVLLNLSDYSNIKDTGSLGTRLELYMNSFYIWLDNPFLGVAYKYDFSTTKMIAIGMGAHSEWLDLLAKYGLLSVFLMIYIFTPKKVYKYNQGYKLGFILFIILGFLNPIYIFNIFFIVFFYSPLLDDYFFSFQNNNKWNKNENHIIQHCKLDNIN